MTGSTTPQTGQTGCVSASVVKCECGVIVVVSAARARLARYRKFLVAAVTVLAQVVSLGVAQGTVQNWLVIALAAAGALGVYAVPNGAARLGAAGSSLGADADPPA